jgi:hypothetical protein
MALQQALDKADHYLALAASAKNSEDRAYNERMHRKWLGLANGWRMINNVDKKQI